MSNTTPSTFARPSERGAISIKTLLIVVVLCAIAFIVLKIAPGYHMIRAGTDRTELAEVRAGRTARVDFARAP